MNPKRYKLLKRRMLCGFNLSCVGDDRGYSFVKTPFGNTLADKAMSAALFKLENAKSYSFLNRGSDERQYCSPGIDLPVGSLMRSKYHEYKEYHSSADNLQFVNSDQLMKSFELYIKCLEAIEENKIYQTTVLCEPPTERVSFPLI